MLEPVDVYVLLKISLLHARPRWSQSEVAHELSVSPSVVNRALKKAAEIRLYWPERKRIGAPQLEEAIVHGARYFIAPKRGGEIRGMLTAWAAPPLTEQIAASDALPPVWPDPEGQSRGLLVEPLHPSAPKAAVRDKSFYELLALVDVFRIGGPRERALAALEFHRRLGSGEGN